MRREQHAAADFRRRFAYLVTLRLCYRVRADVLGELDLDGLRGHSTARVSWQLVDGRVGRRFLCLAPLRL